MSVFLIKICLIIQDILPYNTECAVLKKFAERGPGPEAVMFNKKKLLSQCFYLLKK